MKQRKEQDEPVFEQPGAAIRRGRRGRLVFLRNTTYTVDELPALIEKLRREEVPAAEIERRRRLAKRADRWRQEMPVIETPVKDWIRSERGEQIID
ncbi:MAG: hypothetical protein HY331_08415 [Chloroflexi bacterium]|nr:hypothetical protein [Chloroflexota bacterium]